MPDRGGPRPSGARFRVGPPARRSRLLLVTVAVLAVLGLAFVVFSGFWTDWLWYRSVRYSSVFTTRLATKLALFVVFGLLMAVFAGTNIWLGYRLRPPLSAMSSEQHSLDQYRLGIAPYRRWAAVGFSALAGVIAGASAAGEWRVWLQWVDGTPFGTRDAQFHRDVAFYAFDLPWYRFLVDFGFSVVAVALLAAALVHYLYGGLRLQGPGRKVTTASQSHLAVLLGLFVALKAVAYWLDRYGLALKSSSYRGAGAWTGLRYVDANAYLPAKTILCFVAVICAVLFLVSPLRRSWALPLTGLGLMVLSAVLIGGLYPAIVQQFQVKPDEQAKETPYIQKNIEATRAAYGISRVRTRAYDVGSTPSQSILARDRQTLQDIRLLDPDVVSPTFEQMQQQRSYYTLPGTLDVDRYDTGHGTQDTVIGLRELNLAGISSRNWINDHFKYTHGYGVVAAKGNEVTNKGQPDYTEFDLPPTGALGAYQPRIYYGEHTTRYSIVGGGNREIDYTADGGDRTYQYAAGSGVSLSGLLTRAAYAAKFGEPQILYSGAVGPGSRILYDRTPKERVEAVAPWLTIDGDPYPVVQGGRIVWVVDGYTTTNGYPFSTRTTLGSATTDSKTDQRGAVLAQANQVNYIRNSVKATVDAYTGKVTLYQWDTADPVLRTWMKAFPGTVRPRTDIPAALVSHLRYPPDLFKVQRDLLTQYHVTRASTFFNGTDVWQVPSDPTSDSGGAQPPYYLTVRMPGQATAAFSLTTTFVPNRRDNLAAFMAVDADPGPDYGTIRILTVPTNTNTPGPKQVQSQFNANTNTGIAYQLNLLRQGDSDIEYGNLLTLPVGGGLLYVEPVYVRGRGADYPLLQKVLAVYGNDRIAFEDTVDQALAKVLGPESDPGDGGSGAGPGGGGGSVGGTGAKAGSDPAVRKAVQDAQQAFAEGQRALKDGDWARYGAAQKALADALRRAARAQGGAGPSPSASPPPYGG